MGADAHLGEEMKVKWLAGQNVRAHAVWGLTHLLLLDGDKLLGPFCANMWAYEEWRKDPDPSRCPWCLEAERWLRLVEGDPLDTLKRIPGFVQTCRKHPLEETK